MAGRVAENDHRSAGHLAERACRRPRDGRRRAPDRRRAPRAPRRRRRRAGRCRSDPPSAPRPPRHPSLTRMRAREGVPVKRSRSRSLPRRTPRRRASRAATGAKMSRPWNVARHHVGVPVDIGQLDRVNRRRPAPRRRARSRPLSGPTRRPPGVRMATPRRRVPTPGSTIATWTAGGSVRDRLGEHGGARLRVTGVHIVGDVDDSHVGRVPADDAVQHRHEAVGQAEIGRERDPPIARRHA